ncbi:membrane protein [Microbacterium phage Cece]|nr:membrane protein [Microbacterium phage Cece]
MNISHYGKSITYIALAAVTFLVTALSDNALSVEELLNLIIVVLGAIGVYAVPNFPEGPATFAKTGIAFLTAGLVAALSFLTGGIGTTEWLQIIIAAFTAIGVYIVPNGPAKGEAPVQTIVTNVSVSDDETAEKVAKAVTRSMALPPRG